MLETSSRSLSYSAIPTPLVRRPDDCPAPKRDRRLTLTRIDKRSRLGKRIGELTAMFTVAVCEEELTGLRRLKVQKAAELTAIAELARGDFMRDGKGSLDDIVRLERKADQAVRALGISEAKPKPTSPLVEHFSRPPARSSAP
jgi:hypothetical protein